MFVLLLTEGAEIATECRSAIFEKNRYIARSPFGFRNESQKVRGWTSTQVGLVVAATFRS